MNNQQRQSSIVKIPNVLIVCNKMGDCSLLEKGLASLPVAISRANSCQNALSMMKEAEYSLVLLDGISDKEVHQLMASELPMIVLGEPSDIVEQSIAGTVKRKLSFLSKPVEKNILRHKVRELLEFYSHGDKLSELMQRYQGLSLKAERLAKQYRHQEVVNE